MPSVTFSIKKKKKKAGRENQFFNTLGVGIRGWTAEIPMGMASPYLFPTKK